MIALLRHDFVLDCTKWWYGSMLNYDFACLASSVVIIKVGHRRDRSDAFTPPAFYDLYVDTCMYVFFFSSLCSFHRFAL